MDLLAFSLSGFWAQWIYPIVLLIVGLGAVIFVHELGHFLVAKLVGIKVERFALGFGPRLFGYRGKETDYCVNLLPLGGYVKMIGQEDFKPLQEGQADPRAFSSKSVGARFAVIGAGVVMNVIFAAVLFIVVCLIGIQFNAPIVGGLSDGFPAKDATITWRQGPIDGPGAKPKLQAGDEILSIDGRRITRFEQLFVTAALAKRGEKFHVEIRRDTPQGALIGITVVGVKDRESPSGSGEPILAFGIVRPFDTVLGKIEGTVASDQFQDGDRVVAVGNQPIHHSWDLTKLQDTLPPLPTTITVLRDGERAAIMVQPSLRSRGKVFLPKDGGIVRAKEILDVNDETVLIRLADGKEKRLNRDDLDEDFLLDILGCRPRVKITGIGDDSPAQAAGLEPGDILLDYGDRGVPSYREMVETNKAMVGTRTSVVVLRDGQAKSGLWVVPKMHRGRTVIGINASVDMSTAVVAGIRKDSPAQKAGIRSGDVIERITGTVASAASQPASGTSTAPSSVSRPAASEPATAAAAAPATAPASQPAGGHPGDVDRPVKGWADAYEALKACRDKDVVITYRRGSIAGRAHIGTLTSEIFEPQDYWVLPFDTPRSFQPLLGPVVRKGPLQAVAWGVNETWIFVRRTYATLRSLLSGTISHKEVIGPVGMGDVAIQMGRESIARLIYFMAMISVSLAVINFLPIPVVDGGHAVFLIIEKIRGKPVPVKVMNIVQLLGLALLLFVFVAVTWQDISRMLSDLW